MELIKLSDLGDAPEDRQEFEIQDMGTADWAMAKIGEAKKKMEERKALADFYHKKINAWLESANKEDQDTVNFMTAKLEPWGTTEIYKGKKKSLKLPCGTVKFVPGRESVEIDDEAACIEWAKTFMPDAVKVTESILKSKIKGTTAPGYHVNEGYPKFVAQPDETIFGLIPEAE